MFDQQGVQRRKVKGETVVRTKQSVYWKNVEIVNGVKVTLKKYAHYNMIWRMWGKLGDDFGRFRSLISIQSSF